MNSDALAEVGLTVTAGGILGFGSSLIGFAATWCGFAADFVRLYRLYCRFVYITAYLVSRTQTTYFPPDTPLVPLFLVTYFGLALPLIVLQIFGAAAYTASYAIVEWSGLTEEFGVPGLIGAMVGVGHGSTAGKVVVVLMGLSVASNMAVTIYSAGLSVQICVNWLLKGATSRSLNGVHC